MQKWPTVAPRSQAPYSPTLWRKSSDRRSPAPDAHEVVRRKFSARSILIPLALAQFIASYAATHMNVAVNPIAHDLGTTVIGVQTAITLFTLTMAALMIPGSKLTDIWGRRTCFRIGLIVYGIGALLAALAPGTSALIIGYS
jgi:MFS family permease